MTRRGRARKLKCEHGLGRAHELAMPANVLSRVERNLCELGQPLRHRCVRQLARVEDICRVDPVHFDRTLRRCVRRVGESGKVDVQLARLHAEINCAKLDNG